MARSYIFKVTLSWVISSIIIPIAWLDGNINNAPYWILAFLLGKVVYFLWIRRLIFNTKPEKDSFSSEMIGSLLALMGFFATKLF